jgi:transposase-like protein
MEPERKQSKPRRKYSEEFKAAAVRLVLEEDKGVTQVAKDLGIAGSVVSRWVEQARADGGKSTRGTLTTSEMANFAQINNPTSSTRTRAVLKWEPRHAALLADIGAGHYFAAR